MGFNKPAKDELLALVTLVICLFLLVGQKFRTYAEPLDRDLATYAVLGQEMLHGRVLYRDFWINTPPGIHMAFAAATALVGPGKKAVLCLNLLTSLATLLGMWAAGLRLGGLGAAIGATVGWVLLSSMPDLQGNQPNIEAFLIPLMVWALVILFDGIKPEGKDRSWWAAGACMAAATLFKQVAIFPALTLAIPVALGRGDRKGRVSRLAAFYIPAIAVWVFLGAFLVWTGAWGDFWADTWTFNRSYAGNVPLNWVQGLRTWPGFLRGLTPLAWTGSLGAALMLLKDRPKGVLLLAAAVGTYLAVSGPGNSMPHYYLLWIPIFLLGTVGGAAISFRISPPWGKIGIGCGALAFLVGYGGANVRWFRLSPEEWSQRKFGQIFLFDEGLGKRLGMILGPEETFYQFGNEPSLYIVSGKRPPAAALLNFAFVGLNSRQADRPPNGPLAEKVLADLERNKPEICVVNLWDFQVAMADYDLVRWIKAHYRPLADSSQVWPFWLLGRTGGRLDREGRLLP